MGASAGGEVGGADASPSARIDPSAVALPGVPPMAVAGVVAVLVVVAAAAASCS